MADSFRTFALKNKPVYRQKFPFLKDNQILAKLRKIWRARQAGDFESPKLSQDRHHGGTLVGQDKVSRHHGGTLVGLCKRVEKEGFRPEVIAGCLQVHLRGEERSCGLSAPDVAVAEHILSQCPRASVVWDPSSEHRLMPPLKSSQSPDHSQRPSSDFSVTLKDSSGERLVFSATQSISEVSGTGNPGMHGASNCVVSNLQQLSSAAVKGQPSLPNKVASETSFPSQNASSFPSQTASSPVKVGLLQESNGSVQLIRRRRVCRDWKRSNCLSLVGNGPSERANTTVGSTPTGCHGNNDGADLDPSDGNAAIPMLPQGACVSKTEVEGCAAELGNTNHVAAEAEGGCIPQDENSSPLHGRTISDMFQPLPMCEMPNWKALDGYAGRRVFRSASIQGESNFYTLFSEESDIFV